MAETQQIGWETVKAPPTHKQAALLEKLHVNTEKFETQYEASAAIATRLKTNETGRQMAHTLAIKLDGIDDAKVIVDEAGEVTLELRTFIYGRKKIVEVRTARLDWAELRRTVNLAKKGAGG